MKKPGSKSPAISYLCIVFSRFIARINILPANKSSFLNIMAFISLKHLSCSEEHCAAPTPSISFVHSFFFVSTPQSPFCFLSVSYSLYRYYRTFVRLFQDGITCRYLVEISDKSIKISRLCCLCVQYTTHWGWFPAPEISIQELCRLAQYSDIKFYVSCCHISTRNTSYKNSRPELVPLNGRVKENCIRASNSHNSIILVWRIVSNE